MSKELTYVFYYFSRNHVWETLPYNMLWRGREWVEVWLVLDGVAGQRHFSAASVPGNSSGTQRTGRRLGGPQWLSGRDWRRGNLLLPLGFEQKMLFTVILGIIVWRGCFKKKLSYQSTKTTTTPLDRINVYGSLFISCQQNIERNLKCFLKHIWDIFCISPVALCVKIIVNRLLKGA